MKIPIKKLKSGFTMPVFGIGTWQMGGRFTRDYKNDDQRDIKAIRAAIDSGITHIDTAEIYANGHAEKLVGQAIKNYKRSKLFLASKVSGDHLQYDAVLKAVEQSLSRLRTNYLDLYLIHWPNPKFDIKQTMAALDRLIDEKIIRHIGVCNFAPKTLRTAQNKTNNKIVYNQVHYNLIFREPEKKGLLKYCQDNGIFLSAWRPVQKGALTKNGIAILDEMCKKYKKPPAQIAINWLISQKNVITLSKTSNIKHLKENLDAIGWKMKSADIERLRVEFPDQKEISDVMPLK